MCGWVEGRERERERRVGHSIRVGGWVGGWVGGGERESQGPCHQWMWKGSLGLSPLKHKRERALKAVSAFENRGWEKTERTTDLEDGLEGEEEAVGEEVRVDEGRVRHRQVARLLVLSWGGG